MNKKITPPAHEAGVTQVASGELAGSCSGCGWVSTTTHATAVVLVAWVDTAGKAPFEAYADREHDAAAHAAAFRDARQHVTQEVAR